MTTKAAFLTAYRQILSQQTDPRPWTEHELDRFMDSVQTTVTTERSVVNLLGEKAKAAWRAIGCKGPLTYKAVRALPEGDIPPPSEEVLKIREERAATQAADAKRWADAKAQWAAEKAAELEQAKVDFMAGKQISGAHFEALLRQHEEVPIQLIGAIRRRIIMVGMKTSLINDTRSKSPVPMSIWQAVHRLKDHLSPKEPVDPKVLELFTRPQPAEA
jgi:hypothetical protein